MYCEVYKYNHNNELVLDNDDTSIANRNPFRYKSYYLDIESGLYYLNSRYYNPKIGRFITIDNIKYIDENSIYGYNLYCYCGNNPVFYSLFCFIYSINNIEINNNYITISEISSKPLTFSRGIVDQSTNEIPEWMEVNGFYIKGSIGWQYTFEDGFSYASLGIGVIDAKFHTPKWFNFMSDDNLANPDAYLGFGAINLNASMGIGISCTLEIVSVTAGIQFGKVINIDIKGYVGAGFSLDFTNGIKFGVGSILGFEINIYIDIDEIYK